MLDVPLIAQTVAAFLAPYLPSLLQAGQQAGEELVKKAGESLGEKVGEEGWKKAQTIWGKLLPIFIEQPALQIAAENTAKRQQEADKEPDNADKLKSLEMYRTVFQDALQELLDKDPALANDLAPLANDEVVQRMIARGGSIEHLEQTASGGPTLQEAIAEEGGRIIGGKQTRQ